MKIAFLGLESWQKDVFTLAFPKDTIFYSLKSSPKDVEILVVFVHDALTAKMMQRFPKLQFLATMSTGYDHIDLQECRKRGIKVSNVPVYGENTVAEFTFALMLGLSRKLMACVERTRQGSFELQGLRGFDLRGKTLGIVGCGNIGQHVARIAQGFEMNIVVFDVHEEVKLAQKLGFHYVDLDTLLKESDIVTLHIPYNQHTHHLIDNAKLKLMKKSAYLINTSRGAVVDTSALVQALNSNRLAGAGIDVLEEENYMCEEVTLLTKSKECNLKTIVENHILREMPKVLLTPHNAFNTQEALMRILQTTIDNIKAFKKGRQINSIR